MEKKVYQVVLDSLELKRLNELKGFLAGLNVAGKQVPGDWTFKQLLKNLKEVKE